MREHKVYFPTGERPDTNISMIAAVVLALIFNVLFFIIVAQFKGTFIRDLYIGRYNVDMSRVIFQALTMYMFSLSIVTVVLKRIKLSREFAALEQLPLPEDLDMGDEARMVEAYQAITAMPDWQQRIACNRIVRVLAMWINSRDFERTIEYTRENSEMDYGASDASFRANRLFIWSLPLLGFLGTVYGVSYGIGGFAEFLTGGDISTDEIMNQVGIITQGLAVAFYTTLVGLFTAGIAAFPNMGAEQLEEKLLSTVDGIIEERLTARMTSAVTKEIPVDSIESMRGSLDYIANALSMPVRELVASIEEGFRRMPTPSTYQSVFAGAIAAAGDMLNQKYAAFQSGYEQRIGELSTKMEAGLAGVARDFKGGAGDVAKTLQAQAEAVASSHQRMMEEMKSSAAGLSTKLEHAATSLSESSLRAADGSKEAMRQISEQMQRLVELGTRIDALLQASRSMQETLAGLAGGTEFQRAMTELRQHLQSTQEMIERLSRPRHIVLTETH